MIASYRWSKIGVGLSLHGGGVTGGKCLVAVQFQQLGAASSMNVHTYEVMGTADYMLVNMVNIETGIRGYVASGNEAFLAPYL
ncbi:CHASE3 domain-containing protein, partial [Herbaspirillum sp. B65]|uniref:CHASE3 domain-containing protein n=1 Tax=Herbaspirillum sp. B65 TaxID=137708 RepID=UPI002090B4FF